MTKICISDLMFIWVMKSCNWWRWCHLHNTLIHGCKSLWMLACCIVSLSNTLKFQCIPLFIYCMPLLRKRKSILQAYNIVLMDYHDIFRRFQGAIRTSTSRSTIKIVWSFLGDLLDSYFHCFSCWRLWEFSQYIWRSSNEGRLHYNFIPLL